MKLYNGTIAKRQQPLSLLLKACKEVDHLSLYDVVNTPGVTADLSHISSVAKIEGYLPDNDGMKKAFTGADMVIIPAGIPRMLHTQLLSYKSQDEISKALID